MMLNDSSEGSGAIQIMCPGQGICDDSVDPSNTFVS